MLRMQVPTAPLIFNDIQLRGYWMSRWYTVDANRAEAQRMLTELSAMIVDGQLTLPPAELVPVAQFADAFDRTMNVQGAPKQILTFE